MLQLWGKWGYLAHSCKGKSKGKGQQGKGVNEIDDSYGEAEAVPEVNIGGVWMIAEVGENKKVSKPTKPVTHPLGLKPSMVKKPISVIDGRRRGLDASRVTRG